MREPFTIDRCRIQGFCSLRDAELTFGRYNVVIGANGAGKSNLVQFFRYLQATLSGSLHDYSIRQGGASVLLFQGPKTTTEIAAQLKYETAHGAATLHQRSILQPPDTLAYSDDHAGLAPDDDRTGYVFHRAQLMAQLKPAQPRTNLVQQEVAAYSADIPQAALELYKHAAGEIGCFHFDDTSMASAVRMPGYLENNQRLRSDAGNLAAFLFRLQEREQVAYSRIVSTIRLIAPFFETFELTPSRLDPTKIRLNWRQNGSDELFGPHQLSDGTLRCMALIALLRQPENEMPRFLVIDEPELGLHPYALNVVSSLLQAASHHVQIVVTTQSAHLLDDCRPEDVIVAERQGNETIFRRPDPDRLADWLEDYSLGEIWEKNIIGGGPH